MHTIKVTADGDSIGIVLPKSALGHLQIEDGDYFQIEKTSCGIELTLCDAEFTRQLKSR